MSTAAVTSKGQITIPVEVRKKLGVKAGDRVYFIENDRGEIVVTPRTGSIEDVRGMFKWKGKPLSIAAMNKLIEKGWSGQLKIED